MYNFFMEQTNDNVNASCLLVSAAAYLEATHMQIEHNEKEFSDTNPPSDYKRTAL